MSLPRSVTLHAFHIYYLYVAYKGLFAQLCQVSSAKFLFITLLPSFGIWPFTLILITAHVLLCNECTTLHTNAQFTFCTTTLKSYQWKYSCILCKGVYSVIWNKHSGFRRQSLWHYLFLHICSSSLQLFDRSVCCLTEVFPVLQGY